MVRYLGNMNKMEVHDLEIEKVQCQIQEIKNARHDVRSSPDTLEEAHEKGYDNCAYCIGSSRR